MFSKQRHSREASQPINTGALAAASAIGKATINNGRAVDRTKLPFYNQVPNEIKRSSSMMGSRQNSLQRGMSAGRNNSLSNRSSMSSGSHHNIHNSRPVSYIGGGNNSRSQSLESQRRNSSRNNSLISRKRESNGDLQRAFHEFGGVQASGVIHQPSEAPRMVKRYVPSANGLIAIEVPVQDNEGAKSRSSSLRRSASTNGLSLSRSGSLTRKKTINAPSKTQQKRHSSLTESSSVSSSSVSSSKLHSASTRAATNSMAPHPLIETYVVEETEQELHQEDVVRPIKVSESKEIQLQANREPKSELESELKVDAPDINLKGKEKGRNTTEAVSSTDEHSKGNPIEPLEETMVINEKVIKHDEAITEEKSESSPVTKKMVETTVDDSLRTELNSELKHSDTADTEFFDSKEVIEPLPVVNHFNGQEEETILPISTHTRGGTSLAQHLRAMNPYLSQVENAEDKQAQATDNGKLTAESSKGNDKDLYKVPSPMKSALKKSTTRSSNTSSVYSEYSPANDAYLSLTTAENTRLNAKLVKTETPSYKPRHPARPQSMVNSAANRSSSPVARDGHKTKRESTGQPQKVTRNSVYKTSNDSNASVAINAAKVSVNSRKPMTSTSNTTKFHQNGSEEQARKTSHTSKRNSSINNDILYPREPPAKKSSFEKLRNQESSHMGFKKLSLRDETIVADNLGNDQGYKKGYAGNDVGKMSNKQRNDSAVNAYDANRNFLQNSGWKSRIHDSDSEEDVALFSSAGTSGSTQATSNDNQPDSSNGGKGFSFFKNKNKSKQQSNETEVNFSPPQPRYLDANLTKEKSAADSTHSTPNKINKKLSRMSLRSSSTGDVHELRSLETPKSDKSQKRYHSHATMNTGNNSNNNDNNNNNNKGEVMKSKTLRANTVVDDGTPTKKKNALGKKLKKLFGRKS